MLRIYFSGRGDDYDKVREYEADDFNEHTEDVP